MEPITEEDLDRLQREYDAVKAYTQLIAQGDIRSLIVSGPPGVGKSVMIQTFLSEFGHSSDHHFVQGKITPLGLYLALHARRASKQIVILDDTDSIFKDNDGQNILKNAMDTKAVRKITWQSSRALPMNTPDEFTTEGGVVLITNVGFDGNTKANIHLKAIKDRSYPLQVGSDNIRERFVMINFMVVRQGMLNAHNLSKSERSMLMMFLFENVERVHNLSLRTMVKIAELYRLQPQKWRDIAATGLLKQP